MKYTSAEGFRTALLDKLRDRSMSTVGSSSDMDSLLKITASERFLARLTVDGTRWVLKGGLNLLARLGPSARLTRDADVATGLARQEVEGHVRAAADRDLDEFMKYRLRGPEELEADGEDGGLRFAVDCLLAGKPVATFNLDVVLVEPAAADIERVTLLGLLAFADVAPVEMPAVGPARQMIEKLHAYTRDYGLRENSRPRDLIDMLAMSAVMPFGADHLRSVGQRVFAERARQAWPPALKEPPEGWTAYWDREGRAQHGLPDLSLGEAFAQLQTFWSPVLSDTAVGDWSPIERVWR